MNLIDRDDLLEKIGEEPPLWNNDDYMRGMRDQWRYDINEIKAATPIIKNIEEFNNRNDYYINTADMIGAISKYFNNYDIKKHLDTCQGDTKEDGFRGGLSLAPVIFLMYCTRYVPEDFKNEND